jgi:S1-C subfamily serine protease
MIGMVTLNYSPHRFLGNAIPVEAIRHAVDSLRAVKPPGDPVEEPEPGDAEGSLGVQFEERNGKVMLSAVQPGGAAEQAGLAKGDVVLAIAGRAVATLAEAEAAVRGLKAGALVWIRIEGVERDVKIIVGEKP